MAEAPEGEDDDGEEIYCGCGRHASGAEYLRWRTWKLHIYPFSLKPEAEQPDWVSNPVKRTRKLKRNLEEAMADDPPSRGRDATAPQGVGFGSSGEAPAAEEDEEEEEDRERLRLEQRRHALERAAADLREINGRDAETSENGAEEDDDEEDGDEDEQNLEDDEIEQMMERLRQEQAVRRSPSPSPTPPPSSPTPRQDLPSPPPANPNNDIFPPPPPLPALEPSPRLPAEIEVQLRVYEWITTHSITDAAFNDLRILLRRMGRFVADQEIDNLDIKSKASLRTLARKVSTVQRQENDVCPAGCFCYTDPQFRELSACPFKTVKTKPDGTRQEMICGLPRKRGLTAKEKSRRNPPPHGRAAATYTTFPFGPFVDAIFSNPVTARELRLRNERTKEMVEKKLTRINGINEGRRLQKLSEEDQNSDSPLLLDYSLLVVHASDGAQVYDARNPSEPIKLWHSVVVNCSEPPLLSSKHNRVWRYGSSNGAGTKDALSFTTPFELDMVELEKPKMRFNGEFGREVLSNVVVVGKAGDQVEINTQSRVSGSNGKVGCSICLRVSCKSLNNHYYPAHLSTERGVPDVDLVPGKDPDRQHVQIDFRSLPKLIETLAKFQVAWQTGQSTASIQLNTGQQDQPGYYLLTSSRRLYPFWWSIDPMHLRWKNAFVRWVELLFGRVKSVLGGPPLSPAQLDQMDALQLASRKYLPKQVTGTVRSIVQKFGDLKAWEMRNFVTQILFYVTLFLTGLPPPITRFIILLAKVGQLLERKSVETEPILDADPDDFDLTHIPDDGVPFVPLSVLRPLLHELLYLSEYLFVGRNPAFLASAATPSTHKMIHEVDQLEEIGPADSVSQFLHESIIGTDLQKIGSRLHPVADVNNRAERVNTFILIRLLYDFPPLSDLETSDCRKKSISPKDSSIALLFPKAQTFVASTSFHQCLNKWAESKGYTLDLGKTVEKWGRLQLSNGSVVRSCFREKIGTLPETEDWGLQGDEEGEDGGEEGDRGDRENASDLHGKKANRSARFVKVMYNKKVRVAEVESFHLVPISNKPSQLVAFLTLFPPITKVNNMGEIFERDGTRTRVVVEVEKIRGVVGLVLCGNSLEGKEIIGVTQKAGVRFTARKGQGNGSV